MLSHYCVDVVTATAILVVLCDWALFVVGKLNKLTGPWCIVSLEVGRPCLIGLRVAGSLRGAGIKMWPVTFGLLPLPAGCTFSKHGSGNMPMKNL